MPDSMVINGTSYASLATAFTNGVGQPASGTYFVTQPFGIQPREEDPQYDDILVGFAGVDGLGRKRMGFRNRKILVMLVTIGATRTAVEASKTAILDSVTQLARFSVTVPGGVERQGCTLARGGADLENWVSIANKWCLVYALSFIQLSTTN